MINIAKGGVETRFSVGAEKAGSALGIAQATHTPFLFLGAGKRRKGRERKGKENEIEKLKGKEKD